MNLAAWKYRRILSEDGGPVRSLYRRIVPGRDGNQWHEVYAMLNPDLIRHDYPNKIYGATDGAGTATRPHMACYKAISEALERWAYHSIHESGGKSQFGFDVDPSTCGMAAYPGLTKSRARENAFLEAVERWSLGAWWIGELAHEFSQTDGHDVVIIQTPWQGIVTTIVYGRDTISGAFVYGFAAGRSIEQTLQRSFVEFLRNQRVLRRYASAKPKDAFPGFNVDDGGNRYEKRLLHFADEKGHRSFQNRLSQQGQSRKEKPTCLVDKRIPGPWDRYATVWRVLFQPVAESRNQTDFDFFLF